MSRVINEITVVLTILSQFQQYTIRIEEITQYFSSRIMCYGGSWHRNRFTDDRYLRLLEALYCCMNFFDPEGYGINHAGIPFSTCRREKSEAPVQVPDCIFVSIFSIISTCLCSSSRSFSSSSCEKHYRCTVKQGVVKVVRVLLFLKGSLQNLYGCLKGRGLSAHGIFPRAGRV